MKRVVLHSVIINVAPNFSRAIWRERDVNRNFDSVKEMRRFYNLANCNYDIVDADIIIRSVRNGKIDSYGNRYR